MPKVSVIVPIYGVEKYLKEAINSILNQTLKDIEIILIDDGSKDNCPQIIDEYAAKDSRIIAIHKENGGYGQTCNVGLEKANGEYIAILEPDDYIDENMYNDLYNIAKQYDSDIVKSNFFVNLQSKQENIITENCWDSNIPENKTFTIKEYPQFLCYHPSIWSCLYKRDFLNNNGIRFVEAPCAGWTDNPFQVQTMCLAKKINYTSNAYYYWRRLNYYESDDLKDYSIPFKRCDEIHQWLEENNFCDEQILSNLYRRELKYIVIVLGMKTIENKQDCYDKIKQMCLRMDENIILKKGLLAKKEKKCYYQFLKHPLKMRFMQLLKRYRKDFIQIHITKREKFIRLFGRNILRRVYGKKM